MGGGALDAASTVPYQAPSGAECVSLFVSMSPHIFVYLLLLLLCHYYYYSNL